MSMIYRVNMTDLSVTSEPPGDDLEALGGRALTSQMIADEVLPSCHPLSDDNKLIFARDLDRDRSPLFRQAIGWCQEPVDSHDQGKQLRRNGRYSSRDVRSPCVSDRGKARGWRNLSPCCSSRRSDG